MQPVESGLHGSIWAASQALFAVTVLGERAHGRVVSPARVLGGESVERVLRDLGSPAIHDDEPDEPPQRERSMSLPATWCPSWPSGQLTGTD
jgi:hypothetical protein